MSVGADIEAVCGRCGTSWHVVIAMAEGRIAQVECRQCGKRHRLRAAGSDGPRPHRRTGAAAGSARVSATRPLLAPDPARPPRAYRPAERYAPADRIEHPRFGLGVVERVIGPGKIQVFFADGQKVLVHERAS